VATRDAVLPLTRACIEQLFACLRPDELTQLNVLLARVFLDRWAQTGPTQAHAPPPDTVT
jgi:hypothetical protein